MPKVMQDEPADDFGWEALSDEQLNQFDCQRASSERAARESGQRLRDKMPQVFAKLAINLFDLDRLPQVVLASAVTPHVSTDKDDLVVMDKSRLDEVAVVFTCPVLQAASICDVLRSHDRDAGDAPTRVYVFRKTWSKVPGDKALSVVRDGEVQLNPAVFRVERIPVPSTPPPTKRVMLGKAKNGQNGLQPG